MKKFAVIFLMLIFIVVMLIRYNYVGSISYAIDKAAECRSHGGVWTIKTEIGLLNRTIYYTDCTIYMGNLR